MRSARDLVPPAVLGLVIPGIGAAAGHLARSIIAPAHIVSASQTNANATHTFSSMVPARTQQQRYAVVLSYGDPTARTIDSVTIAGVTAANRINSGLAGGDVNILDAVVPVGAIGDVVVDLSGANGIDDVTVSLYTVGDYSYRTGDGDTGTNTAVVPDITVFKGEFAVGGVHCFDSFPGAGPMSWTNLTEDDDNDFGDVASGSAHTNIAADGTLAVQSTSANGDEICCAVAVYRY